MDKILLMGNPNVGKSVVFARLTGANVICSNYPGATVEFCEGVMHIDKEDVKVIDVPGTYTLVPNTRAEEVAVEMLDTSLADKGSKTVVINVMDSTNMERSLNLTLQLIKRRIPVVAALNLWDETKHTGIRLDVKKLEDILGIPCVPTVALTGEGIMELADKIKQAKVSDYDYDEKEKWHKIGDIVEEVQRVVHRHHTFLESLADLSVSPVGGIPIAAGVIYASFQVIRFIGEGLIGNVGEPFFENVWAPLMLKVSAMLGSGGIVHNLLIGNLIEGQIDFGQSFGVLTTGLFVPIAAVLPYILSFYLVLSVLEDFGYLPRLSVLVDKLMHSFGLHGYGIIPMFLGLGCNVPGALSTRIMETKRQRFIAMVMLSIGVPCTAMVAMIFALVGSFGPGGMIPVFGTLFVVWAALGIILNKVLKGHSPELFIEVPPYRIPSFRAVLKKLWMRTVWFLKEAIPFVMLGILIINVLYTLGIIQFAGNIAKPVVSGVWGLPPEAVGALIVGFLRKDVAVGMLMPLGLTMKQLITASVILAMYFPCAATFAVLIKEFGVKDMFKATLIMISSTLLVGGLLNLIL